MKKLTCILIGIGLAASLSGCHMMIGTPSGIREMSRWNNGLITQGKSAPNTPTGYWTNELDVTKQWGSSYGEKWQRKEGAAS